MQRQTLVSVITIVRNGERFLHAALSSIRRQYYSCYEIIIVDGQSTDSTASIARLFPAVNYLLQPDLGLARARNLGITAVNGDLVAFLNHDDLWHPDKLARQVALHNADPAILYSVTQMVFHREPGSELPPGKTLPAPGGARTSGTPSALVARRELFTRFPGFDPRFTIGCDAEWFTRMRDLAVPMAVVPEVLLYKRLHESNLSRNVQLNRREMFQIARESIAWQRQAPHEPHRA